MTVGSAARQAHPRQFTSPRWRPSERLVFGMLGFVLVLGIWEAASRAHLVKTVVLSSPTLIWDVAVKDISSGIIWPHLQASAIEYFLGLAIALLMGIPLGLALGVFRKLNYLVDPWLSALYATPIVALVPLIILIGGIGLGTKVIVVWLEAIVVITVSAMIGVHAADAKFHDIAQSFNASAWTRFRTVVVPASVPFILTGVRIATSRGLVGVVIAEFLASDVGIGFYISLNGALLRTSRVYFGIVILGIVGVILAEGVRVVERRFERWRPAIN
jgi:ABC-type nitrate/sulfonate/bicarbonate transport system permease component